MGVIAFGFKKIFWSQLQWLTFPNEGQQNCRHRDKHERPHLVERTLSLLLMWLCAKKKGGRKWGGHDGGKDLNPG